MPPPTQAPDIAFDRSDRAERLFPPGVAVVSLRGAGDPAWLLLEELAHIAKAAPSRVREFAAGRACARHALARFGLPAVALPPGDDRQPRWPHGFTGSITHTDDLCAVAVARTDRVAALGIDAERARVVHADLWRKVLLPTEVEWTQTLPEAERLPAATAIFSAKEAFYKCQYALTLAWLGFQDARIRLHEWGRSEGAWSVEVVRGDAPAAQLAGSFLGRFLALDTHVLTGCAVLAANPTAPTQ